MINMKWRVALAQTIFAIDQRSMTPLSWKKVLAEESSVWIHEHQVFEKTLCERMVSKDSQEMS